MNYDRPGTAAIESAHAAIALDPNHAFCHYALASVIIGPSRTFNGFGLGIYLYRHRLRKARRPALRAVQLDPLNPYPSTARGNRVRSARSTPRLSWADKGLHVRPDHIGCANVRAKRCCALAGPPRPKRPSPDRRHLIRKMPTRIRQAAGPAFRPAIPNRLSAISWSRSGSIHKTKAPCSA